MYSTTEVIAAGAETVWRHLTVPELMQDWMTSIDDLRTSDGAPLESGSKLIFRARAAERTSDVIEFEEGEMLALRSVQGPVTAVYRYRIVPLTHGCRATLEVDCRAQGVARLMMPLIKRLAWITDRGQIKTIKRIVESTQECRSSGMAASIQD